MHAAERLPSPDVSERELIASVQAGDTDAFEALVRGYLPRARAIARRMTRNQEDADDLVQDAFLRALERIDRFDAARPFGPWFFRLLVNAGHDAWRRQTVRRTEPHAGDQPSNAPSPHEETERAEIRERFAAALESLPPRQRAIVWSFEVDGMTTAQIAEELGVAQVTVRWHLHHGRRALREALGDFTLP